jgi:hypothetical protein
MTSQANTLTDQQVLAAIGFHRCPRPSQQRRDEAESVS